MQDGDESPVGRKISHIKARETLDRLLRESKYHSRKKRQCRARLGADSVARAWAANARCSLASMKLEELP